MMFRNTNTKRMIAEIRKAFHRIGIYNSAIGSLNSSNDTGIDPVNVSIFVGGLVSVGRLDTDELRSLHRDILNLEKDAANRLRQAQRIFDQKLQDNLE